MLTINADRRTHLRGGCAEAEGSVRPRWINFHSDEMAGVIPFWREAMFKETLINSVFWRSIGRKAWFYAVGHVDKGINQRFLNSAEDRIFSATASTFRYDPGEM